MEAVSHHVPGNYQAGTKGLCFSYEGDDKKGVVLTHFKEKTLPGLKVIREDGKWKLNEN